MLPFCFFSDPSQRILGVDQRQQQFPRDMGHHSSTCVIILDLWSIFTLILPLHKDGGPRISHWANGECSGRMDDDHISSIWWLLLVCSGFSSV
jgi:hypothetical protein